MDLIGKATRNEFREALVGFVLRDIEMFFDGAGLSRKEDFSPPGKWSTAHSGGAILRGY